MTEQRYVEFVAGPTTPPEAAHMVGRRWPVGWEVGFYPAPGFAGSLFGYTGIMRDDLKFELAEVDMRSPETKLLDEAAEILRAEPRAGERVEDVALRHARAQHLLLKAQLAILRRQR